MKLTAGELHRPSLFSTYLAACVHEMEHECLLVVEDANLSVGDNLIGEVEQRRDDLQTRFVHMILPTEQFE